MSFLMTCLTGESERLRKGYCILKYRLCERESVSARVHEYILPCSRVSLNPINRHIIRIITSSPTSIPQRINHDLPLELI
jgi:hypothetical protein